MNDQPTRSYFAVISANVRYCKALTANAKLLYAEITALANEKGYCFASNRYFAELYNTDIRTIQRYIQQLDKLGFIHVEIVYFDGTKQIKNRYISLNQIVEIRHEPPTEKPPKKPLPPPDKIVTTPHDKIVTTPSLNNNIYINNKRKLLKESSKIAIEYLNEKIKGNYSPTSLATLNQLETLFDNGYTLENVKKVIDNKTTEWLGTSFERYLRPQTLFGKNFDNYLNDKPFKLVTPNKQEIFEHGYTSEQLNSTLTSIDELDLS